MQTVLEKPEQKKEETLKENPNLSIWNKVCRPPKEALKQIKGGRLSGMTDVNPQWRIKAMTEQFGLIGFGWKYNIAEKWNEPIDGQVACFVKVELFYKCNGEWSEPVIGIGGSMLLTREKNGLYLSDEGYKMALTDALSVAMKQLGIAADIYAGLWDGSKYKDQPEKPEAPKLTKEENSIIEDMYKRLFNVANENNLIPDRASIRTFVLTKTKAKKLPTTPDEIATLVDNIITHKVLNQVCKPKPKQ